jgi:hypothetical protein
MRAFKRWSQYSKKWQNSRRREGLDPKRWNRWQRLSDKTRATTDPYEYSKGVSVLAQSRKRLLDLLTPKVKQIADTHTPPRFKPASMMTLRMRLANLPTRVMQHALKVKNLYGFIVKYNRDLIAAHAMSELFYHGGAAD